MTNPLEGLLKLPIRSDGMMYLWDAVGHMVADVARIPEAECGVAFLIACAAALNHAYDRLPRIAATESLEAAGIALPVRVGGPQSLNIIDANGVNVLRIRGWARLQYLGQDAGKQAQNAIADAFVMALNALTKIWSHPCEWNPDRNKPLYWDKHRQSHAEAEVVVGADGQWHLCASCAALPRFKRYRRRKDIVSKNT